MVDIFMKRTELMPPDESMEQHQQRRADETEAVEKDKSSATGLFRGTFPKTRDFIYDEADGVTRCPVCLSEYEGGELCNSCGAEVFQLSVPGVDSTGGRNSWMPCVQVLQVLLDKLWKLRGCHRVL